MTPTLPPDPSPSNWMETATYYQFQEKSGYLQINNCWLANLTISGLPNSGDTPPLWLTDIVTSPYPHDLSYHLYPLPTTYASAKLQQKLTQLESQRRLLLRTGRLVSPEIDLDLQVASDLLAEVQAGQDRLLGLTVTCNLYAPTLDRLRLEVRQLRSRLAAHLITGQTNFWQQGPGWESTIPQGRPRLTINQHGSARGLTASWPFVDRQLNQGRGVIYGLNREDQSPIIVDRFALTNANSLTIAQSGSGKSYLAKLEIMRSLTQGVQVIIVDPEGEYRALATSYYGRVIDVTDPQQFRFNLFAGADLSTPQSQVQTINDWLMLLATMVGGLSLAEKSVLDQTLVTWSRDRSNHPLCLSSLINHLRMHPQLQAVISKLQRFTSGSLAPLFDQPTTDDHPQELVVFDLSHLAADLRPLLMTIIGYQITHQRQSRRCPRLIVIDEAWLLTTQTEACQLMSDLMRRARKRSLGLALISQQTSDFLQRAEGQALVSQAALKFIFRLDSSVIRQTARQLHLTPSQQRFLLTAPPGQGLVIANNQRAYIQVVASDQEALLVDTSPQRLETSQGERT